MTLLSTYQENDDCRVNFKREDFETSDKSTQFVMPVQKREYQKQ